MNTHTISLEFPSDIYLALNESENEIKKEILLSFAVYLYQQQKLTIGKAAKIAGLSRLAFETYLSENHISISNLNMEDVLEDVKKLK